MSIIAGLLVLQFMSLSLWWKIAIDCKCVQTGPSFWFPSLPGFGCALLQILICMGVVLAVLPGLGVPRDPISVGLLVLNWPVAGPVISAIVLVQFAEVLFEPVSIAATIASLVGLGLRTTGGELLRRIWPSCSVVVFVPALLMAGEAAFQNALHREAKKIEPTCANGGSFIRSLSIAGSRNELHAIAQRGSTLFAWSFRKGAFYPVHSADERFLIAPIDPISNFPSCAKLKEAAQKVSKS